jgi:transposase
MASNSSSTVVFIGLDVASRDGWAALPGHKPRRFELSPAGAESMAHWARQNFAGYEVRVVMEHTGVYSEAWARLLREAGLSCALCNPARIRQFARGAGIRSKTDRADAVAILAYAAHHQPRPSVAPAPAQRQLAILLKQQARLDKQLAALHSHLHSLAYLPDCLALVEQELLALQQALQATRAALQAKIDLLVQEDAQLAAAYPLLSIPGIGPVTAIQLCALLEVLHSYSPAQLTALAGLAPAHQQSGSSLRGQSRIDTQGRAALRRILYIAAWSASRYCPPLARTAQQLKARGKPGKLIMVAIARKLLLIAQAVVKQGHPFEDRATTT